jgi:hypothetical protein
MEHLSQDIGCPGQDSSGAPPEHKSEALPPERICSEVFLQGLTIIQIIKKLPTIITIISLLDIIHRPVFI